MAKVDDDQLLDAAMNQLVDLGLRRTTTEDVARAARVNRATLYRRLGDKDAIVRLALEREVRRFIEEIRAYIAGLDTFEERTCHGFARTVLGIREHPLVQRMLAVEDYETLASMTVGSAAVLDLGTDFVKQIIETSLSGSGVAMRGDREVVAAIVARLIHSLALFPEAAPRLASEAELRAFASDNLLPLFVLE